MKNRGAIIHATGPSIGTWRVELAGKTFPLEPIRAWLTMDRGRIRLVLEAHLTNAELAGQALAGAEISPTGTIGAALFLLRQRIQHQVSRLFERLQPKRQTEPVGMSLDPRAMSNEDLRRLRRALRTASEDAVSREQALVKANIDQQEERSD
jgi:hypothetical protein